MRPFALGAFVTKAAKLYLHLLANPRQTVSFRDFEALVLAYGFTLRRQRGSHKQYKHPDVPELLTITRDGSDALGYQVRQLLDMAEVFGLSVPA